MLMRKFQEWFSPEKQSINQIIYIDDKTNMSVSQCDTMAHLNRVNWGLIKEEENTKFMFFFSHFLFRTGLIFRMKHLQERRSQKWPSEREVSFVSWIPYRVRTWATGTQFCWTDKTLPKEGVSFLTRTGQWDNKNSFDLPYSLECADRQF